MGSSEDRAQLREQERIAEAARTAEILIPGYGIWTVSGVKELLEEREAEPTDRSVVAGAKALRELELPEGWVCPGVGPVHERLARGWTELTERGRNYYRRQARAVLTAAEGATRGASSNPSRQLSEVWEERLAALGEAADLLKKPRGEDSA